MSTSRAATHVTRCQYHEVVADVKEPLRVDLVLAACVETTAPATRVTFHTARRATKHSMIHVTVDSFPQQIPRI